MSYNVPRLGARRTRKPRQRKVRIMKPGTLKSIESELANARKLFPKTPFCFAYLVEEVGELSQALANHTLGITNRKTGKITSAAEVYMEAIQVAVMAIRLLEEGDASFRYRSDDVYLQASFLDNIQRDDG